MTNARGHASHEVIQFQLLLSEHLETFPAQLCPVFDVDGAFQLCVFVAVTFTEPILNIKYYLLLLMKLLTEIY